MVDMSGLAEFFKNNMWWMSIIIVVVVSAIILAMLSMVTEGFSGEEQCEVKLFYAPWCGYCKKFAPVWDELEKKYSNNPSVKLTKVNGDEEAGKAEAEREGVEGYPTIFIYSNGEKTKYTGERDVQSIEQFLKENYLN